MPSESMALSIGTQLGSHEITALLGKGGMGEVYRARDLKLKREVAIKILPDEFAGGADRLSRFQREAEVLAALNHPNIGAIYDLAQSGETRFLVLELVEGETLAERIARGPIPVEETLHIAKQICEALEAAHERDIIHRDLKPANIKLTPDGKVKVLDFGLAKVFSKDAREGSASNSPTLSMAATQQGIILGTAAYMSPEQARGRNVDKRGDVFAFGCILYEMLTGKPAFEGSDVSEVLASVIKSEPGWDTLPGATPPVLRVFLRRCLEKDLRRRIHDIGDVRLALEGSFDEIGQQAILPAASQSRPHRWHLPLAAVIAAAAAVLITVVVFQFAMHLRPGAVIRLTAEAPNGIGLGAGAQDPDIAISPDGRTIAYVAGGQASSQLYVRRLNELQETRLTGINRARNPFFSPDGNWIGFFDGRTLKKVPVNGGSAITICNLTGNPRGASWGTGDVIIFSTNPGTGLMRVPAEGGTPEVLTKPDPGKGEVEHLLPEMLPGGRTVLFTVLHQSGSPENAEIDAIEMQSGKRTVLIRGGSNPHYAAPGHIVYGVKGTLWAVRFDVDKLQVPSAPVKLAENVVMKSSGAFNFSIAQDGPLVYVPGEAVGAPQFTLVWVDRQGHEEPIPAQSRTYQSVRLSPDGTQVALEIRDQENGIWTWDFGRKNLTRLTFDSGLNRGVAWSPDGLRLAFSRQLEGSEHVYWQSANGTGMPELLAAGPSPDTPTSFSPDGKLLFETVNDGHPEIGVIDVKSHKREILMKTTFSKFNGEFSPDGRWIAYASNELGNTTEIYVRPFPNVDGGRWQVGRGRDPVWSRNGKEIFFLTSGTTPNAFSRLFSVPVQASAAGFSVGNPQPLFEGNYTPGTSYDVSPDGKRFLMIKLGAQQNATHGSTPIVVVLNWLRELQERAPLK
jgi:serine/threonine-protein kinase